LPNRKEGETAKVIPAINAKS